MKLVFVASLQALSIKEKEKKIFRSESWLCVRMSTISSNVIFFSPPRYSWNIAHLALYNIIHSWHVLTHYTTITHSWHVLTHYTTITHSWHVLTHYTTITHSWHVLTLYVALRSIQLFSCAGLTICFLLPSLYKQTPRSQSTTCTINKQIRSRWSQSGVY
jgi:hypothetical protein